MAKLQAGLFDPMTGSRSLLGPVPEDNPDLLILDEIDKLHQVILDGLVQESLRSSGTDLAETLARCCVSAKAAGETARKRVMADVSRSEHASPGKVASLFSEIQGLLEHAHSELSLNLKYFFPSAGKAYNGFIFCGPLFIYSARSEAERLFAKLSEDHTYKEIYKPTSPVRADSQPRWLVADVRSLRNSRNSLFHLLARLVEEVAKADPSLDALALRNTTSSLLRLMSFPENGDFWETVLDLVMHPARRVKTFRPAEDADDAIELDFSVYARGFLVCSVINSPAHRFETQLASMSLKYGPESVLADCCENTCVIGMSATAPLAHVGNFNWDYLSRRLQAPTGRGVDFGSPDEKERLCSLSDSWAHHCAQILDPHVVGIPDFEGLWARRCAESGAKPSQLPTYRDLLWMLEQTKLSGETQSVALASCIDFHLSSSVTTIAPYEIWRLMRLLCAICLFVCGERLVAGIAFFTGNFSFDSPTHNLVREFVDKLEEGGAVPAAILFCDAQSWDSQFKQASTMAAAGKRALLVTSYASAGEGKSVTRPAGKAVDVLIRCGTGHEADFDFCYCDLPTNVLSTKPASKAEKLKAVYENECLCERGEIAFLPAGRRRDELLAYNPDTSHSIAHKRFPSARVKTAEIVMQAISRITRGGLRNAHQTFALDSRIALQCDLGCSGCMHLTLEQRRVREALEEMQRQGPAGTGEGVPWPRSREGMLAGTTSQRSAAFLNQLAFALRPAPGFPLAKKQQRAISTFKAVGTAVLAQPRPTPEQARKIPNAGNLYVSGPAGPGERLFYACKGDFLAPIVVSDSQIGPAEIEAAGGGGSRPMPSDMGRCPKRLAACRPSALSRPSSSGSRHMAMRRVGLGRKPASHVCGSPRRRFTTPIWAAWENRPSPGSSSSA